MFLKTLKHSTINLKRVGRDMAAYTLWSDRVCQQKHFASLVDSAINDLPQINNKHHRSRKELDMWQLVRVDQKQKTKQALQVVSSISGSVAFTIFFFEQIFRCLSRISCEVKCTVREGK